MQIHAKMAFAVLDRHGDPNEQSEVGRLGGWEYAAVSGQEGQRSCYGARVHASPESYVSRRFPRWAFLCAAIALSLGLGCAWHPSPALVELTEARAEAADLRVQFSKAADAANRAVMADTDEASIAYAREADQTKAAIRAEVASLGGHLRGLGYTAEIKTLDEFGDHFSQYEALDRGILELAVENTNLKAQRLSFGPAREAADAFRDGLGVVAASTAPKERCRVDALVAKAVIAVREVQVLQAPHIAESDDAAMSRLEAQITALQATAREAVHELPEIVDPKMLAQVDIAVAALGRFEDVTKEIVRLSRRNSNVRSLELSLRQKPAVTAACDESLRAIQDALAKKAFTATR